KDAEPHGEPVAAGRRHGRRDHQQTAVLHAGLLRPSAVPGAVEEGSGTALSAARAFAPSARSSSARCPCSGGQVSASSSSRSLTPASTRARTSSPASMAASSRMLPQKPPARRNSSTSPELNRKDPASAAAAGKVRVASTEVGPRRRPDQVSLPARVNLYVVR